MGVVQTMPGTICAASATATAVINQRLRNDTKLWGMSVIAAEAKDSAIAKRNTSGFLAIGLMFWTFPATKIRHDTHQGSRFAVHFRRCGGDTPAGDTGGILVVVGGLRTITRPISWSILTPGPMAAMPLTPG